MDTQTIRGEIDRLLLSITRLGEGTQYLLHHLQTNEQFVSQRDRSSLVAMNVARSLSDAAAQLDSLRTELFPMSVVETPTVPKTSLYPFHVSVGPDVTNAILSCEQRVTLHPDHFCATIHDDIRNNFFKQAIGAQPFLLPLLSLDSCCVFVDDVRPIDETDAPRKVQPGFTTAAIASLATKLLNAENSRKAVLVVRGSNNKLRRIDLLLDLIRQTKVQVVNLTSPNPPPSSVNPALPRLIVCSPKDLLEGRILTEDVSHLILDDVVEADADLFRQFSFRSLVDVAFRGPPKLVEKFPIVKGFRYTARIWMYHRSVSVFDTQTFSIARDVEVLFASFPSNQKLVMFTTDSRAFVQGVKTIHSLDQLEQEVDHLVVVDTPFALQEMRNVLKKGCARYVTLMCGPAVSRKDLAEAIVQEKFREVPFGLQSYVESPQRSTEPSPAPVAPFQY